MMLLAFIMLTKSQVIPQQCGGLLLSYVAFARPTQLAAAISTSTIVSSSICKERTLHMNSD